MKTVISHFYNEEYLLPFWLKHHKKYFDHGILINYHSTDKSVEIIKEICPDWEIINTEYEEFSAYGINEEVKNIEKKINGWKIALCVTEFLVGDFSVLKDNSTPSEHYMHCLYFVDDRLEFYPPKEKPIYEYLNFAVHYKDWNVRNMRCLHNHTMEYPSGRHFGNKPQSDKFIILYFNLAPFNQYMINRKLQIQNKIPRNDKIGMQGWEHYRSYTEEKNNFSKGFLCERDCYDDIELFKSKAKDVSEELNYYLNLMNNGDIQKYE